MDFFNQLDKSKGGYIFLSHSHDDIIKVRKIRNELEERGFEPLCFFLKCLCDNDEIEDLIKREIDAREWFVFVNSENSRKSKWVTLERRYIEKTDNKKVITLNIDDESSVIEAIDKITHNLRIFMTYSPKDREIAYKFKQHLEHKDYLVFDGESIPAGANFMDSISGAITMAAKDGCVLALITPNSLVSRNVIDEIMLTINKRGNIIPVVLGDFELSPSFELCLSLSRMFRISANPTDSEIADVIDKIGRETVK